MSPPINFLIERMNFDIFIFLSFIPVCFYIKNNYLKFFLILFLALLKIYPIFLIIFDLIYVVVTRENKNLKDKIFDAFSFFAALIYLLYISIGGSSFTEILPSRPDRTFGLLSEAININLIFGFNKLLCYLFLFNLVLLIALKTSKDFYYSQLFSEKSTHSIILLFLMFTFYANYDYRMSILLILFPKIIKSKNIILKYSYFVTLFFSPGIIHSYNFFFDMVENNFMIYLDIPLYFLIACLLVEYVIFLKLSFQKQLNKKLE